MAVQTLKASGALAHFKTPSPVDITSCKVYFSPKQSGSGDPSPSNVRPIEGWTGVTAKRCGKNLFDKDDVTDNYALRAGNISDEKPLGQLMEDNLWQISSYIAVSPSTQYTINYNRASTAVSAGTVFYTVDKIPISGITRKLQEASYTFTTPANACYLRFSIYKYNNNDHDIQLELGSTATTYESYHDSTTNYEFGVLGKNKFNPNFNWNTDNSYRYIQLPELSTECVLSFTDKDTSVDISDVYVGYSYYEPINSTQIGKAYKWCMRTGVIQTLAKTNRVSTGTDISTLQGELCQYLVVYPKTDDVYNRLISRYDIQLEFGSTATTYEAFNSNHTVYGGYVDLVSGEVVENTDSKTLDGTDDSTSSNYINYANYVPSANGDRFGAGRRFTKNVDDALTTIYCDSLPIYYDYSSTDFPYLWVTEDSGRIYYMVIMGKVSEHPEITSSSDARIYTTNWLKTHPVTVRWKTTPTEYQLAPSELKTLAGSNSFWSNADSVEVEYELTEPGYIRQARKRMLQNVPHLVSESGGIASFNTNMRAKLKECKVNFQPVQAGTGEPSPSNIRPISGLAGCTVYRTGKNMWNPNREDIEDGSYDSSGNFTPSGAWKVLSFPCTKGQVWYKNGDGWGNTSTFWKNGIFVSYGSGTPVTIPDGVDTVKFQSQKSKQNTVQLSVGASYEIYEPYSGTTYPVTFPAGGKNLFGSTLQQGAILNATGVSTDGNNRVRTKGNIPQASGTYTVSATGVGQAFIYVYGTNGTYIQSESSAGFANLPRTFTLTGDRLVRIAFRVSSNNETVAPSDVSNVMLNTGSSAQTYEPYMYTAYAGYLDLKTGILTVTQGIVTMDGTGSTNEGKSFYGKAGTTKNIQFYTYLNDLNYYHPSETGNRPDGICNMAHTITRDEATGQDFTMPTGIDVGYETFVNPANNKYTKRITFPLDTEIDTLAKANNWLADLYTNGTPLQFTYTFGTPLTYQLDPVDIVTLKGVNNIWSDAGNVEVKYWKH